MNTSKCSAWCKAHGLSVGLLVLRLAAAYVLISSGAAKLFGNMDMFTGMVGRLGFPAPALFAYAAALTEFVGGILLALGLWTCFVAPLVAIVMLVALFGVHKEILPSGMGAFFLLAIAIALSFIGSGRYSVARYIGGGKMDGCCGGDCACGKNGKEDACCKH